jgi:hypothetical protein
MVRILFLLIMTSLPNPLLERLEGLRIEQTPRVLVVSVSEQKCFLFVQGEMKASYGISTALKGAGQVQDSYQTPLGLHRIGEKIGAGVAKGTVFRCRVPTGQIWASTDVKTENLPRSGHPNLITSRILWLEGLEPGFNQGKDGHNRVVDSHERYIYIHGTSLEDELGRPASRGCIHLGNAEVIELFEQVQPGDLVWIQE